MRYIDSAKIESLLSEEARADRGRVGLILDKAAALRRLDIEEVACLLAAKDPGIIGDIFKAASSVKNAVYGRRVVLFAPLYVSNLCLNNCLYCGFRRDNLRLKRRVLTLDEIRKEVSWLLSRGHKRILMVAGEGISDTDYYVDAIRSIYEVSVGPHRIRRVNINCAPLSTAEFARLKGAGIGTYQIFQETYHEATYRRVHPSGPKSDPDNRIEAVERAFAAGIDDIGMGVLYGLYDWRFEVLALLMHIEELERKFNVGPHTISVPRIEPAEGAVFNEKLPRAVSDEEFKRLVAILRLAVPYTGIILSTREPAYMRDELFSLGVSQVSAESRTSPGGYSLAGEKDNNSGQFSLSDTRSLEEVMATLIEKDFIPSFCAACYRKERTGEAFMQLAKPGTIKGKCSMNALITLKEYLDDFASPEVKQRGYQLIGRACLALDAESRHKLSGFFSGINRGARDEYV